MRQNSTYSSTVCAVMSQLYHLTYLMCSCSFLCILLPSYPVLQWTHAWIASPVTISEKESGSMYPVKYITYYMCYHSKLLLKLYAWMYICGRYFIFQDSMHLFFCCRWCSHRINTVIHAICQYFYQLYLIVNVLATLN